MQTESSAACAAPTCPLTGTTAVVGEFTASDPRLENLATLHVVQDLAAAGRP